MKTYASYYVFFLNKGWSFWFARNSAKSVWKVNVKRTFFILKRQSLFSNAAYKNQGGQMWVSTLSSPCLWRVVFARCCPACSASASLPGLRWCYNKVLMEQYRVEVKSWGLGATLPGFQAWFSMCESETLSNFFELSVTQILPCK